MVLSPSNSLQCRAGNMHALAMLGTPLPRPNASVPAVGCDTTPFPRPNASVPAVGFGAGRCESGWTHRSMCRRDSRLSIHINSDDFCGNTSGSQTCNGGYYIWEIVRDYGISMWISMYYMPIALAHLGRTCTRLALEKNTHLPV